MARRHKVKRYYGESASSFRAKPRLITIVLIILLFAGLGYVGTVIYKPAYDFIMNIGKAPEASEPDTEPESSEAREEEQTEPSEPPAEPVYKDVRAAYAPPEIVSDEGRFESFLDRLDSELVNAVMIDIKNGAGDILFQSGNEAAKKWELITPDAVNLSAVAEKIHDRGFLLAVKMSVFRDPKAASAGRLDYAIRYQDSNFLWLDNSPENDGKPWLNPYSSLTRDYIASIMAEAIDAGAELVALEDVRFPDNSAVYASFGEGAAGMSRSEMLKSVIIELTQLASEKNARAAAYFPITEITNTEFETNRYGGGILDTAAGLVMPDVRTTRSGSGSGGLEAAVRESVESVARGVPPDTGIIPVLEGGGKEFISAQTAAVKELGMEEYILYDAEGRYEF